MCGLRCTRTNLSVYSSSEYWQAGSQAGRQPASSSQHTVGCRSSTRRQPVTVWVKVNKN